MHTRSDSSTVVAAVVIVIRCAVLMMLFHLVFLSCVVFSVVTVVVDGGCGTKSTTNRSWSQCCWCPRGRERRNLRAERRGQT